MTNKYNRWLILISVISLIFVSSTCIKSKDGHNCITTINYSDIEIQVKIRYDLITNPADTFLKCGQMGVILKPGEQFCWDYGHVDNWDDYLNVIPYIQFMFYSQKLKGECNEDSIKVFTEKYQLKRYQLTKEDLDGMNWIVAYPSN